LTILFPSSYGFTGLSSFQCSFSRRSLTDRIRGGLVQGSSADPRYNLSYLVHQSVLASKPIIGISLNYRLSAFGFLWSQKVKAKGTGNLGLRDQRLALHWIQENISAFGGDPRRVTLWGESSGGYSVGKQILAYGGRDDGLFRGAIMESGFLGENWPYWRGDSDEHNEALYRELTTSTGCDGATSPFECLRTLPLEELNKAQNNSASGMFGPWVVAVDGDIVQELGSVAMKKGNFVKVPILLGTNTDEGTGAAPRKGIDTDADFEAAISLARIDTDTVTKITHLYPNIHAIGIPKSYKPPPEIPGLGKQYKRSAAFFGDAVEHAPRRLTSISWSSHKQKAYSFRWNIIPNEAPDYVGSTHFAEIPWVFGNLDGKGYDTNPFGDSQRYREVSKLMNRIWISFVVDQDPNLHGSEFHCF
jgi:carboxylesterase type B